MPGDAVRLESWRITPECREVGSESAWLRAVAELKQVYDAQLDRFSPGNDQRRTPIVLVLSISRETELTDDDAAPETQAGAPLFHSFDEDAET